MLAIVNCSVGWCALTYHKFSIDYINVCIDYNIYGYFYVCVSLFSIILYMQSDGLSGHTKIPMDLHGSVLCHGGHSHQHN